MNLRQRTLLAVAATLTALMAGAYFVSSSFVLKSFDDLERTRASQDVERVTDELTYQLREMHQNSSDWSNWDDTYQFMVDKNQAYIKSNLNNILLNLDLMAFFDADGKVFYSNPVPRPGHQPPPKVEDIRKALKFDGSYGRRPSLNRDFCGIVSLPDGQVAFVSVRPIVKTSGQGPAHGWTVFALRLDDHELTQLAERTHLGVQMFPLNGAGDKEAAAVADDIAPDRTVAQPLDEKRMAGYTLINDAFGQPVKLLRVIDSRPIHAAAVANRGYLMQFTIVAGVAFALVILLVLEFAALSRVSRLSRQVELAGSFADGNPQIELPGKDELSWLASKISGLVDRLHEGRRELKQKNEDLEHLVELLGERNDILANAVEGIAVFDSTERITSCNAAFAAMNCLSETSAEGTDWHSLIISDDHERMTSAIREMRMDGKSRVEVRVQTEDGAVFEEITLVETVDDRGVYCGSHWFTREITERKNLESRIQFQAFHDSLTGLPNRSLFVDRLRNSCYRAARRQGGLAVLFIDLDGFKLINDSMGHEAGDQLLIGVASRIQHALRPHDTVARFGGDEFVVLADMLREPDDAVIVAERILQALEAPISLSGGKAFATASIGIVYTGDGSEHPEALLHDADVAMYGAKEAGSRASYMVFSPAMNAPAMERKELAEALDKAIHGDGLSLHYQPVIELHTGRPTGIEALLRWNHPERGPIPPNLFIATAEEAGLMDALGTWALRTACLQMKQWIDSVKGASDLTMHVNISGKQLQRADFVDTVTGALSDSGLPPQRLRLEIAAKLLSIEPERTAAMLADLRSTGLKLALDDVGGGYTLISRSGPQPFDMVKIDGSVIWSMESDENARSLVEASLIMARSMKAEIAAEGIETMAQLNQLRELGCKVGQGFIFGRPLPPEEIAELLVGGAPFLSSESQDSAA